MILEHVSRETTQALQDYEALTLKWTSKINLVAPSTREDFWSRHIVDSAQVFEYIPAPSRSLVDLGSGGGFPALVIAIIARELKPKLKVQCIESDGRKATFLRTVIRELDLNAGVFNSRIEDVDPSEADVVTARALAPVVSLLRFAERHRRVDGKCLFLKGSKAKKEVSEALSFWQFDPLYHPSQTEDGASLIEIGDFSRV